MTPDDRRTLTDRPRPARCSPRSRSSPSTRGTRRRLAGGPAAHRGRRASSARSRTSPPTRCARSPTSRTTSAPSTACARTTQRSRPQQAAARPSSRRLGDAATGSTRPRASPSSPTRRATASSTAQVVGMGPAQSFSRTVTIDAGTADGVVPDLTVVNADGLVGRVIAATRHSATVLLIVDRKSTVGGRLGESMELGFLDGRRQPVRRRRARASLVDHTVSPQVGDDVVTWGSRNEAPYVAGVPIGKVVSVHSSPAELTADRTIDPYVDFSSLDLVARDHGRTAGPDSRTVHDLERQQGRRRPMTAAVRLTSVTLLIIVDDHAAGQHLQPLRDRRRRPRPRAARRDRRRAGPRPGLRRPRRLRRRPRARPRAPGRPHRGSLGALARASSAT